MGDERNRQLLPVAWDLETLPMAFGRVAPPIVCMTWSHRDGTGEVTTWITTPGEHGVEEFDVWLIELVQRKDYLQILCNGAFDFSCVAARDPRMLPHLFEAIEDGRVHDVAIRERLLNLATTGNLEFVPLPDGSNMRMNYSLAELETYYLGWDRSADKKGEDAWRNHYDALDGVPLAQWPKEAIDYPKKDAEGTLLVWEAQEKRRHEFLSTYGFDPLKVQDFRVMLAFALRLITCKGIPVDQAKVREITAQVDEELSYDRLQHLITAGILEPAEPPRAYKNGNGFTKGKKEKLSEIKLHALIEQVCADNGIEVQRTEKGNVKASKDVLEDLWPLSPILEEHRHRQTLTTTRNKELPPLTGTTLVYSSYDPMVSSGRTSSYGDDWAPSVQIQNYTRIKKIKDRDGNERGAIDIRQCHIARDPGWVLYSCDYSSVEFMSVAQKCYELFGYSRMRDLLLAGVDPHVHLGSRIARQLDPDFSTFCDAEGLNDDEIVREAFASLEKSEDENERAWFSEQRQYAKNPGFGFWGGMGIKKFIITVKKNTGLLLDEDTARRLKEITMETYPEMREWFSYVEKNLQVANGEFAYFSPLGMYRAGCSYTDTCNGAMLQTPATGEGAPLALCHVVRACYDESVGNNLLLGTEVLAYVHDEIVGAVPKDGHEHERVHECARIMTDVMKRFVMKDVPVKVAPVIMTHWSKKAKPKFDANKRLVPWSPSH